MGFDVDELFQSHPITQIREIEQNTRKSGKLKQDELRTLVGTRYKDLIASADSIVLMRGSCESLNQALDRISCRCEDISIIHSAPSSSDSQGEGDVMTHMIGNAIHLLTCAPHEVSMLLSSGDTLSAARVCIAADSIMAHLTSLSDADHSFLKGHVATHSRMAPKVTRACARAITTCGLTSMEYARSLHALSLLQSFSPDLSLATFLSARLQSLLSCFQEGHREVKESLLSSIDVLHTTLVHVRVLFQHRNAVVSTMAQNHEDPNPCLLAHTTAATTSTSNGFLTEIERAAETLVKPKPLLHCVETSSLSVLAIARQSHEWQTKAVERISHLLSRCLEERVDNANELLSLFDMASEAIRDLKMNAFLGTSSDARLPQQVWVDTCRLYLGRDWDVWSQTLSPIFVSRAQSLVNNSFLYVREQWEKEVANALMTTTMSLPSGTIPLEHGSQAWSFTPSDISISHRHIGVASHVPSLAENLCEIHGVSIPLVSNVPFGISRASFISICESPKLAWCGQTSTILRSLCTSWTRATAQSNQLSHLLPQVNTTQVKKFETHVGPTNFSKNLAATPELKECVLETVNRLVEVLTKLCGEQKDFSQGLLLSRFAHGLSLFVSELAKNAPMQSGGLGGSGASMLSSATSQSALLLQQARKKKKGAVEDEWSAPLSALSKVYGQGCQAWIQKTIETIAQHLSASLSASFDYEICSKIHWKDAQIHEGDSTQGEPAPKETMRLPAHPSTPMLSTLSLSSDLFSRQAAFTFTQTMAKEFSSTLLQAIAGLYQNFKVGGSDQQQDSAFQMWFDVKCACEALVGNTSGVVLDEQVQKVLEGIQEKVDPIDWAVCERPLDQNVVKYVQRTASLFAPLRGPLSSAPAKLSPSDHSDLVLSLSQLTLSHTCPAFVLLPTSGGLSHSTSSFQPILTAGGVGGVQSKSTVAVATPLPASVTSLPVPKTASAQPYRPAGGMVGAVGTKLTGVASKLIKGPGSGLLSSLLSSPGKDTQGPKQV